MVSVAPNSMMIRRALNGAKATYRIDKHPRLFLATNGRGGGSWRIRYRPYGGAQQCWLTISSDARNTEFEAVVKKAKELLTGLELEGIDPRSDRPREGDTFDGVFRQWLERYAKQYKKSWQADQKLYDRHIKSRLGLRMLRSIDRLSVISVLDSIAVAATPLQANRCQSVISAVFSWALDEGRIEAHPALRIRRRGEEHSRDIIMTSEQLRQFWPELDALFENAKCAIKLLLLTGQRLNEVVGCERVELELDKADPEWTIPGSRTKNGLTHIVPLTPAAGLIFRDALRAAGESPFVFPARRKTPQALDGNQVSRQCKEVFRKVGTEDMRLHDLRHQAATGMAQCGVPMEIRQMVQNQITGRRQSIGSVYDQHDYGAEKRMALELWERSLLATLAGDQSPRQRYR